jgi:hypothetical protein
MGCRLTFLRALACSLLFGMTLFAGCGGGSADDSMPPPPTMTLNIDPSSIDIQQDGNLFTGAILNIANAPGPVTVTVTGLPSGITAEYESAIQTLSVAGGKNVPAGSYVATVTATSGTQTASQELTVVNDVVAVVHPTVDTTLGVDGKFSLFISTSFQIGAWTSDYFGSGAQATERETTLNQLGAQHIRVQVVDGAVPMIAHTGLASDWNFTLIDTTLQPVLASADHSPELQIGTAPEWMCLSNGQLDLANHLDDFAAFMANMVRYYNKGGFDYGGRHFQSPSTTPVIWWGVFNEFNLNGLSANDYVRLYNAVVPLMRAVDPMIKLSALELSDFGLGSGDGGDPMQFMPEFVAGATAPVDVISTHFYSSCNQRDTDAQLMNTVPEFATSVRYFYEAMKSNPVYANTPVWVTENNVNADWSNNGRSQCNPSQAFVTDERGTSAFFAGWRPYVFSQLGKAGNQALYHWAYTSDQQYGEVDGNGNNYLSYWVDKTLADVYPATQVSLSPEILTTDSTEASTVEVLSTKAADGTIVVMVANYAVNGAADNNGAGPPRTVVVELDYAPNFSRATLLTIDSSTNTANGPRPVPVVANNWRRPITLNGYGVAFLTLKP